MDKTGGTFNGQGEGSQHFHQAGTVEAGEKIASGIVFGRKMDLLLACVWWVKEKRGGGKLPALWLLRRVCTWGRICHGQGDFEAPWPPLE